MNEENCLMMYSIKINKTSRKFGILFEDSQDLEYYRQNTNEIKKYIDNYSIFSNILLVLFLKQTKRKTEIEKSFKEYQNIGIYIPEKKKGAILKLSPEIPIFIDGKLFKPKKSSE